MGITRVRDRALELICENRRLKEENRKRSEECSQKDAKITWLTSKLDKLQRKLPDVEKQLWDTRQGHIQLEHKYRLLQAKIPAIASGCLAAEELEEFEVA